MLTPSEQLFWQNYLKKNPQENPSRSVSASCPGNEEIADGLLALYLEGKKTAASGLVKDYHFHKDPLPQVGDYWIILDSKREPRCIVKTVRVEFFLFREISLEVAQAEGEGDRTIAFWKKAHTDFFSPFLEKLNIKNLEEEHVVVEFFNVVFCGN